MEEIIKLVFLDVDGVLNHERFYVNKTRWQIEENYPLSNIDGDKIKLVNYIVEKTSAKVVISSTWRKSRTVEQLRELFSSAGFVGYILGKTPSLYYEDPHNVIQSSIIRGCEIHEFMYRVYGHEYEDKVNYVIFDDDTDMLLRQKDSFINVDSYCGITEEQAELAINILNKGDTL